MIYGAGLNYRKNFISTKIYHDVIHCPKNNEAGCSEILLHICSKGMSMYKTRLKFDFFSSVVKWNALRVRR